MEMFQEVAESQRLKEENKDASATAGLLEKLTVEESNSDDKAKEEKELPAKEDKKVPVTPEEKQTETDTEKPDVEKKKE